MARLSLNSRPAQIICTNKQSYRTSPIQNTCNLTTCKNVESSSSVQGQKLMEIWRKRNTIEKENWIFEMKRLTGRRKSGTIMYRDNYKYFRRPVVPFLVPKTQIIDIPAQYDNDILNEVVKSARRQCCLFSPKLPPYKDAGTQTDYRDGEAQTMPWEPPCRIKSGHNPEVLEISHFTWNNGLPAGINEIEIIKRMRMRKAYEAILPPMDTPANIKFRTAVISALETDEWAYREAEIQAIMDYRMKLMNEITKSQEQEKQKKVQSRFHRLKELLDKRRENKINSIRHNLKRDLRKLRRKRLLEQIPLKRDIIREHADPTSEMYAPLMRHGEHPQRRHEVIRKEFLKDSGSDYDIDTSPSCCSTYEDLKTIKPKPRPAELCIRQTRWTDEKLKTLHADLKAIRLNVQPPESLSLMRRKYKPPPLAASPYKCSMRDSEAEQINEASSLIQKIVRGRAVQFMMLEGRDRCKELIEEMQGTHALDEGNKMSQQKGKAQMIELQRLQNSNSIQEDRLCEVLNSFEGMTVSATLDFLSNELIRLEEERRLHAFALLVERERERREVVEAKRREMERHRRRQCDEMFRQIIKVTQDSVETYLEDIIKEGIEWSSDEAAKEYILKLCDKVDTEAKHTSENSTELAQEEMIANMIYNFVLPEVEKHNVRENIRLKQQSYLRNAHEVIYGEILDLPKAEIGTQFNESKDEVFDSFATLEREESQMLSAINFLSLGSSVDSDDDVIGDLLESIVSEAIERVSPADLPSTPTSSIGG